MNTPDNSQSGNEADKPFSNDTQSSKAKVTHNLDTGEDEVLSDSDDESIMDFGSGSGGGSAGDGGAS